jgi:hypothetical protein
VTAKSRHSSAVPIAGLVGLLSTIALGTARWWLTPLFLLPLAATAWGWRAGVDVNPAGLVVRGLLGRRQVPWSRIEGFSVSGRVVSAQLTDGGRLRLPTLTPGDLPKLLDAGEQELQAS